jgi:hypothetical protein
MTLLPPFGRTCARSPNRSVALLSLFKCTLIFSNISELNRPPVRSFDKSFLSFSIAFSIPASSVEKSCGSSTSPCCMAAASSLSRSARPFFLRSIELWEKLLWPLKGRSAWLGGLVCDRDVVLMLKKGQHQLTCNEHARLT